MKPLKRLPAFVALILILCILLLLPAACSKQEQKPQSAGPGAEPEQPEQPEQTPAPGEENRIEPPERTLVFGEDSAQTRKPERQEEIVARSAVLRRNAQFLELSGGRQRYPVDLVIGELAEHAAQNSDAREVRALGRRFLLAALAGRMDEVQQMSTAAARDVLSTQIEAWNTRDLRVSEIRLGKFQWEEAAVRFNFRILAQPGRTAGSAVCIFEDEQWRVQAVECDCSALRSQYEPVEYTGFPENYGYFQY